MKAPVLVATLLALATPVAATDYEDPGPLSVGWDNVSFVAPSTLTIQGRIYYPAESAGQGTAAHTGAGPYSLVGMIHGGSLSTNEYDELCTHVASYGFVVASLEGNGPAEDLGHWTAELMPWVDAQSSVPGSFLEGMVKAGPWGLMGHSRGGGAIPYALPLVPQVRVIIGHEPADYWLDAPTRAIFQTYDGSTLAITGTADQVVQPHHVLRWYRTPSQTPRKAFKELIGGGHRGPVDLDFNPAELDPMPNAEQQRIHFKLNMAFLQAELEGVEEAWFDILGEGGTSEPLNGRASLNEPALWAGPITPASTFAYGLGGEALDYGILAASSGPASFATGFGLLGIDPQGILIVGQTGPLASTGTLEVHPSLVGLSGETIWLQGLVLRSGGGGKLTRTIPYSVP